MFLYVTKEISKSAVPLIHQVIPFIDSLSDMLDDAMHDELLLPSVRMAAWHGSTILNRYYGKTDESSIFQIAMSMNLFFLLEFI